MLENVTGDVQNDTFSCHHPSVEAYRYFGVLWGSVVTIVGTVGNMLTILAFSTDTRLRTRFNVLIVNLALADLLYCTLLQPVSVDSYLHLRWRGGVFGLLLFLSNSVSIITLYLIKGSRYLLVARRCAPAVSTEPGGALTPPCCSSNTYSYSGQGGSKGTGQLLTQLTLITKEADLIRTRDGEGQWRRERGGHLPEL